MNIHLQREGTILRGDLTGPVGAPLVVFTHDRRMLSSQVQPVVDAGHRVLTWDIPGGHRAVLPMGHRLGHRKRLRLEELAEETFADFPEKTPGRVQTDQPFTAAGLQREVAFETTSVELLVGLVQEGLAVALLPSAMTAELSGVVALPVAGGPSRAEHLIWDGFNLSPAARALLSVLREDQDSPAGET